MRYVGPRHIVIDDQPTPTPLWHPDRSLEGQTVVLVGGGPSHATADLNTLAGHRLIAINSSCRRVRPIATADDILYFSDNSWNENRPELAADWPGVVVTCNRNAKARLGDAVRYISVVDLTVAIGVASDFAQASSGHIAACLAAVLGARRLVLIGFECRAVAGRTHGHGDYQHNHDLAVFDERFLPGWRALAPALAHRGVEVFNATTDSAVTDFPFMPLAEALKA